MKVLVALEHRFSRAHDGVVYTGSVYPYAFFGRYLRVFDSVVVLARVEDVDVPSPPAGTSTVDGPGVRVIALPAYRGLRGLLRHRRGVRRQVRSALVGVDAAVLRAPGFVADTVWSQCSHQPCAVEVVGDPAAVFANGASDHPVRALLRVWAVRSLRRMVAGAVAVGYVSRRDLAARYPSSAGALTAAYSSIDLAPEAFRPASEAGRVRHLVTVASLEQPYKGIEDLLHALSLAPAGLRLWVVGDGRLRAGLEDLASELGLRDRVRFLGQLPGPAAVREVLHQADAFVLASRTEGLPRAMIEAMAAGLPCVGTTVGGIPDLLPPEALCAPGSPEDLAALLTRLHQEPRFAGALAYRLRERADDFAAHRLEHERDRVYEALRFAADQGVLR